MSEARREQPEFLTGAEQVRNLIREALEEYFQKEALKAEPAYKNELAEERKRREQLERRVNELIEENARNRQRAEEAERHAAIRAELQRLGVTKVDLAFRIVKDDVRRAEDGQLVATTEQGVVGLREYLAKFVNENPEFLPARNLGGSGATPPARPSGPGVVDLDRIRPGMSPEELEQVRREIARLASQSLGGA
ncbi:MAG: hypothetical protein RMK57_16200 [Bryobacterales bacterium]|nr:hypothetical protein [Bryobacteraceae bacterium]MDW8356065.1 hypothetical protein [Bryobacterales bacterium]